MCIPLDALIAALNRIKAVAELTRVLNGVSLDWLRVDAQDDAEEGEFITVHPKGNAKGQVIHLDERGRIDSKGPLSEALKEQGNGGVDGGAVSRNVRLSEIIPGVDKVAISTNIKGMRLGKTKDASVVEKHKAMRSAGDWAKAREYALSLSKAPATADAGDYLLAKYHRDADAALRVTKRCLKDKAVDEIAERLSPDRPVVFVPLCNKEGEGANALPYEYAKELSRRFDGSVVSRSVSKVSYEHNTGANTHDRVSRRFSFEGTPDFPENAQVVIVDDTWTSGQTCLSMAEYLKSRMPKCSIDGITTLAASRYGADALPSEERIGKVLAKAGLGSEDEFKKRTGRNIRSLSGSELQMYILTGAKGVDGVGKFFG